MDREQAEALARQAAGSLAAGDLERALAQYLELERARPNDGRWSHCIADLYRRRSNQPLEILALVRAADRYLAEGAPLRSLVMCKRLLEIAPDLPDTERCLASLHPMLSATCGPERPKPFEFSVSLEDWLPVGAPLEDASLAKALPVASPADDAFPAVLELPSDITSAIDPEVMAAIGASQVDAVVAAPLFVPPPVVSAEDDWSDVNAALAQSKPAVPAVDPLDAISIESAQEEPAVEVKPQPAPYPRMPPPIKEAKPAPYPRMPPPMATKTPSGDLPKPPAKLTAPPIPISTLPPIAPPPSTAVQLSAAPPPPARPSDISGWSFRMTPLFAALSETTFRQLVKKLRVFELAKDQVLFKQGSEGASLFMICMGKVAVIRENPDVVLAKLDEAEFFGEIALVTNQPRTATIKAIEQTLLIEIDRNMVSELIYEDAGLMPVLLWFLRDRLVDTLVRTSPLFERFPYDRRRALADRFRLLESHKDTTIIQQGERSKGLVIILAGTADVVRKIDDHEVALARLGSGDIAGEMSLLTWEPAVATVTARGHFIGLFLPAEDFKQVAAEHPILMRDLERIAEIRRQKLVAALDAQSWPETNLPLV